MKFKSQIVFILALVGIVSGCSTTPMFPQDRDHLERWEIRGKLGVRSETESIAGFLNWKQYGDQYNLYVSGALGQGSTKIKGNSQRITVVSGKKEIRSQQPEELLYEHFGWRFPISSLTYWVQGQPHPHQQYDATYNDDGSISNLKQSEWNIEYFRYQSRAGANLPSYIKLSNRSWTLTFVIKDWLVQS